jgi:hypothetical protein
MKRLGSILLLALVALAATATFDVAPAGACSCAASTEADAFRGADAVFVGTVVDYTAEEPMTASTGPAVWSFAVSDVYKGEVTATQPVVSAVSGATCGLEMPHQGEYLVFATAEGSGLHAGLCGGTRSTAAGPLDPALASARDPVPSVLHDEVIVDDGGTHVAAAPIVAIALVVALALLVHQRRKDAANHT